MWRIWAKGWGPRAWWIWFRDEGFPMWFAWHLPRNWALWVFVRVYSASGDAPTDEYKRVYTAWRLGAGK